MPISWLDHKPHAIAVYASWPALPSAHATLATGRPATALPGPVLHRLDCTSFCWRLRKSRLVLLTALRISTLSRLMSRSACSTPMKLGGVPVTERQGNFSAKRGATASSPRRSGPCLPPLRGMTPVPAREPARLTATRSPGKHSLFCLRSGKLVSFFRRALNCATWCVRCTPRCASASSSANQWSIVRRQFWDARSGCALSLGVFLNCRSSRRAAAIRGCRSKTSWRSLSPGPPRQRQACPHRPARYYRVTDGDLGLRLVQRSECQVVNSSHWRSQTRCREGEY
jgi:hypothetical protein